MKRFASLLLFFGLSNAICAPYQVDDGAIIVGTGNPGASTIPYFPICADGRSDTIGEGWGWQNDGSCVVTVLSHYHDKKTQPWASCSPQAKRYSKFGIEADGSECVVTNETLGFSIRVDTIGDFIDGSWGGGEVVDLVSQYPVIDRDNANQDNPGAACTARGESLPLAKSHYANRCRLARADCDPVDGEWVCSSNRITSGTVVSSSADVGEDDPGTGGGVFVDDTVAGGKTAWSDSYSVRGQCYCDSSFDHGVGSQRIQTNAGTKSVREVCAKIQASYGQGEAAGREYYNSIQCGHRPYNNAGDEQGCPGQPIAMGNWSGPDCNNTGADWNLDRLYPQDRYEDYANDGGYWQPKASQKLTWYMQFMGKVDTTIDADVYWIDSDVDQSVIDDLLSQDKKLMCYISGGSWEKWRDDLSLIPASVIGNDYDGWPGEKWLDISNIELLASVMRSRIAKCKARGFHGMDVDNINAYANGSGFNLTQSDGVNYVKWLANESHRQGMAFSLKNSEDIIEFVLDDIDMLQSESCDVWNNCNPGRQVIAANKPVWMVEYAGVNNDWEGACARGKALGYAVIYRDILLSDSGVYKTCQ